MSTCYYMDMHGNFGTMVIRVNYQVPYGRFFRKYTDDIMELYVANFLLRNPHPNCVTVYDVTNSYIDMEFLHTKCKLHWSHVYDVVKGIVHLNNSNIVYLDLKSDNIGYSEVDDSYKLFDFNGSGLVSSTDTSRWNIYPYQGYIYRDIIRKIPVPCTDLRILDVLAIGKYLQELVAHNY